MSTLRSKSVLLVAGDDAVRDREALGLGDLMRVLTVVPCFEASKITWCSPKSLFPLVRDCPFVSDIASVDLLANSPGDFDCILNLTFDDLHVSGPVIELRDILEGGGEGPLKERVYDLPRLFTRYLDLAFTGDVTVARSPVTPRFDVGFNFRAPPEWKIKELPIHHWEAIADLLPHGTQVSWQPEEDTLDGYFDWVKNCRILLSTVGFGCHVSMFYGRQLVMLVGPTDFAEAHDYRLGRILYPPSVCPYRPCQLPTGVNNCGCMPDYHPEDIAAVVVEMLCEQELPATQSPAGPTNRTSFDKKGLK